MSDVVARIRTYADNVVGPVDTTVVRHHLRDAADEIEALRGAVQSLAGWVRDLDPHPSLDPCDYLTDRAEQQAVRRAYSTPDDSGRSDT